MVKFDVEIAGVSVRYFGVADVIACFFGSFRAADSLFRVVSLSSTPELVINLEFSTLDRVSSFLTCERVQLSSRDLLQVYKRGDEYLLMHSVLGYCLFDEALQSITLGIVRSEWSAASSDLIAYEFMKPILVSLLLLHSRGSASIHHAMGFLHKGRALILSGVSGVGKSTSARILSDAGYTVMSDEYVITRFHGDTVVAYGTPWMSSAKKSANVSAPLKAMYFLQHGEENRVVELSKGDVLERLLRGICVFSYAADSMKMLFDVSEKLLCSVPAFDLYFTPDKRFVDFVDGLE